MPLRFGARRRSSALDASPELVSIHIPKTAGTSFRHALQAAYGEQAVRRVDIPLGKQETRIDEQLYTAPQLPSGTRVVHGHFSPERLHARFAGTEALPHIVWLREPVARVLSNYYYLAKRLREELQEEKNNLNILSKMQRSLPEYAQAERNRNRQHKFLAGIDLDQLAFVGIQEHYEEDLAQLAKLLLWPPPQAVRHNPTGDRRQLDDSMRRHIEQLNLLDMDLYERGLQLRQARMQPTRLELISIHLPKTGGTSLYRMLQAQYGQQLSRSFRRVDLQAAQQHYGSLADSLPNGLRALHGHFRYSEIANLHQQQQARLICWLRDPVDRLISNYHHFMAGLKDPARNPHTYHLNKHRRGESLLTYARRPENRNVMSSFLDGAGPDAFYFVGFLDRFQQDWDRLCELMGWPTREVVRLNASSSSSSSGGAVSEADRSLIAELNAQDLALYEQMRKRRNHG